MSQPEQPEPPSCVLMALPADMLLASADNATKINPVNAPPESQAMMASLDAGGPDPAQFLALITTKYWGSQPRTLTVSFLEQTAPPLVKKILLYMNEWSKSGCIRFKHTAGEGEIRITRAGPGHWSYLGTDIRLIPPGQPTMSLQGFVLKTPESEYMRVIPHEAGHSLGFPHEHLGEHFVRNIDPPRAVAYYERLYGWPAQLTYQNVLVPQEQRTLMGTPNDQDSIMAYHLPAEIMRDGIAVRGGVQVIASDHEFNARVYPKLKKGTTPRDIA